jgi:hypothetical protein
MTPRLRKAHWRYTDAEGVRWKFWLDPRRDWVLACPLRGKTHRMTIEELVGHMRQGPAPDGTPIEDHRQLKLPGVGA